MEHAAYVFVGLDVLAFLLVRMSRRGLTISGSTDRVRLTAGEEIVESYLVEKRSVLPAAWIQLEYADSGHDSLSLPGGGARTLSRRLALTQRGRYQVAAATVTVRDPLGLFRLHPPSPVGDPEPITVTVHPRPLPTEEAAAAARMLTGSQHRWQLESADATLGELREYAPGDAPSRIHWRTTARRGALMVTDPETVRRRACWLLVDLGGGESTAETAAGIAAYLAGRVWNSGQAIGAVIAGSQLQVVPARRGREQTGQILDALATVDSTDRPQLAMIRRSLKACTDAGSFVLITPALVMPAPPAGVRSGGDIAQTRRPTQSRPDELTEVVSVLRALCSNVRLIPVPTTYHDSTAYPRDGVA